MRRPIRILHTETYTHVAGGQRGLLDLVTYMDKERFEPIVLLQGPGKLKEGLDKVGVRTVVRRLEPFRNRWLPFSWRLGVPACRKVIQEVQPDVVHSNHLYVGRYSGRAAQELGVPALVTLRLVHEPEAWDRWNRWETMRIHRKVVSNSLEGMRVHESDPLLAGKLMAIPNGIDLERFRPHPDALQLRREEGGRLGIPENAIVIAQVASLIPQKGCDLLLEAFLRLAATEPRLHLVFVGGSFGCTDSGPDLRKKARQAGMAERIHLTNFVWDVPEFLNLADISVLASREREGLPRALIEAMACGNPIVATRVGGNKELVPEGRNGTLIEPGSADALEAALRPLVADPELRQSQGAEGLKLAQERYGIRRMIREYEEVYEELAQDSSFARN